MGLQLKLSPIFKPVGRACNLRCRYCFYKNTHPDAVSIMSQDVLKKAIPQLMQMSPNEIHFIWHGGEPLLAGIDFYENVVKIQRRSPSPEYKVRNAFQTNGTLLTQEWVDFCREHGFSVALSLDGPEEIHDKQRLFSSGRGSFHAVMEAVKLLKLNNIEFGCLAVITQHSISEAKKILAFFRTHEIFSFDLSPYFEQDSYLKPYNNLSLSPVAWAEFVMDAFDTYMYEDESRVDIRLISNMLKSLLGGKPTLCSMTNQTSCGSFPTINYNGDVYFCDDYEGNENLKLGNILETDLSEMLGGSRFSDIKEHIAELRESIGCSSCKYCNVCGGGCPRYWFWLKNHAPLCAANKRIASHIELKVNYIIDKVVASTSAI